MIVAMFSLAAFVAAAFASGPAGNAFYAPPTPLPPAPHGDVIWARPLTSGAALESAARNILVLYHSTSLDGTDRAVSGTIAVPKGTPPAGGWPVISWAHGTTGNAPACTPSLDGPGAPAHEYLAVVHPVLDDLVRHGYAVVHTDYRGQGTPGIHPYLVGEAEARDTIDIVRAARQLVPELSSRWVVMGHSQGGHAALFTAATASTWAPELQLLGAVAQAPASQLVPLIEAYSKVAEPRPGFAFSALFMQALASVDSQVALDRVLTPAAFAMLSQTQDRCSAALYRADSWGGVVPAASFRADADLQRLLRDAAANEPGPLHYGVPVLLLQGTDDTTVRQTSTDALDKQLCANATVVRYDVYRGLGHRPLVAGSLNDALDWIGARFAGAPAPSNCGAPAMHGS